MKILVAKISAMDRRLVQNTLWMLGAHGGRLVLQGVYFVLMARVLGAQGLGTFTGALALVYIAVPFAGWGMGHLLVQEVSRDRSSLPVYWGNALLVTAVSGTLCIVAVLVLKALIVPRIPLNLVVTLALAELICGRITDTAGQVFQALEDLGKTAKLTLGLAGARLIASVAYIQLAHVSTPVQWGYAYLVASACVALPAAVWVTAQHGQPRLNIRLVARSLKKGGYFSVATAAQSIYTDIDKTMLARLSTLDATGIYAAAYRVVGLSVTPVRSLLSALYARFFQHGSTGLEGTLRLTKRVLPLTALYGLIASLGLFIFAPMTQFILGSEYAPSVDAVRWLALVPFLQSIHYFAADTLTGAGFQGLRSVNQICVAIANVLLNLWLVPTYSWKGAAWATIASEGGLAVGLWITVFILKSRVRRDRSCLDV